MQTHKPLLKCPRCKSKLRITEYPKDGEPGFRFCDECLLTYPFDVYIGDPIVPKTMPKKGSKKVPYLHVCVVCGKEFWHKQARQTCPNNKECFKELTRRNAVEARKFSPYNVFVLRSER